MGTIHDRQLPFKGCLDLSAVQLVVPMVLINAIVYLAVHSGADHHYSTRIRDRNRTSQTRYTLPDSAAGGGVGTLFEEDHDSTEWHSIWEENNAAINEACRPIEDLLMAGETSGNAPLEGIPIGYTKKPGKNGLGDRLKAITGMAILAMAMKRPLRVSVKQDVWDYAGVLKRPKSFLIPWDCEWSRFETQKRKTKGSSQLFCAPNEATIDGYVQQNKTMFYYALGGDGIVDGWWLEKYMASKGKGPKRPGDWGYVASLCIARALFRPGDEISNQLKMDVMGAAAVPVGSTYGNAPDTLLLGVHARYVGRKNIEPGPKRHSDDQLARQIECSWNMSIGWANAMISRGAMPRQVIWLTASDNPKVFFSQAKKYIKLHASEIPAGIPFKVAHSTVGKVRHVKFDASGPTTFRMWLDWFLLSEATACSYSRSGFPFTACQAAARRILSHGKSQQGLDTCDSGEWIDNRRWHPYRKKDPHGMSFEELRGQCPKWL